MSDLVLNPNSNRFVRVGGAKYNRLIKERVLSEVKTPKEIETPETPETIETPEEPEKVNLKSEVANMSINLVKQHKNAFRDLSKEETDKLLRKLLIEKLAPKSKKKKTKSKFKLKKPSSSEESSDSD
jgi:hypothetical protein